jgi:hypothetical protein
MRNACSLGLLPGKIGNPTIITDALMVRDPRPRSSAKQGSKGWWLVMAATWALLTSGGLAAQPLDPELVEEGRHIFFEETFEGTVAPAAPAIQPPITSPSTPNSSRLCPTTTRYSSPSSTTTTSTSMTSKIQS